jgi:hypothetical protein
MLELAGYVSSRFDQSLHGCCEVARVPLGASFSRRAQLRAPSARRKKARSIASDKVIGFGWWSVPDSRC